MELEKRHLVILDALAALPEAERCQMIAGIVEADLIDRTSARQWMAAMDTYQLGRLITQASAFLVARLRSAGDATAWDADEPRPEDN